MTRNLRNLPLTKPIRSEEQYCNLMYTVVTHLLEVKTQQYFASFLQERIFEPLGMKSTYIQPDAVREAGKEGRMFTPYEWDEEKEEFREVKHQQVPEAQGAGSIHTTANDYILWIQALLHPSSNSPITEAVYGSMTKPRIICNANSTHETLDPFTSPALYCAGLEQKWYRGYPIFQHYGGDPGIGVLIFFLPVQKFGGVIFCNGGAGGDVAGVLAGELIDAALDVPEAERPDWNELARKDDEKYRAGLDDRVKEMLELPEEADLKDVGEPLTREMEGYVGRYRSAGYHDMVVEVKDGRLFVDATDRTMGFWLTLKHVGGDDRFVGEAVDFYDSSKRKLAVKFRVEGENVEAVGMDLEEDLEDFVWFDRVE